MITGFPGGSNKRFGLQFRRPGFNSWVGKIPWRRVWLATPVFLPEESTGTEEPGYSPWVPKESDTTERLSLSINAGSMLF